MLVVYRLPLVILSVATWTFVAFSQPLPHATNDPGVVPDDDMTIVVGTRFVSSADETSPRTQFVNARIPLSLFNETDRCIDGRALEAAKDYFNTLGRAISRAGYFYVLPEDEVRQSVLACTKLHERPPQAWVGEKTKIIAFGQAVSTADAPALEKSIR